MKKRKGDDTYFRDFDVNVRRIHNELDRRFSRMFEVISHNKNRFNKNI